jgi:hypothetical protein
LKTISTERASLWYYAHKHLPEFVASRKERLNKWRNKYTARYLLQSARQRAALRNVSFDLKEEDISIPIECPVLKVPFKYGTKYAASLDRINPDLGYVKGNVQVISRKANLMKQDASKEELKRFGEWAINQSKI